MAQFVKIASKSELPAPDEAKEFTVGEKVICLANVDGALTAMRNEGAGKNYLRLALEAKTSNRSAVGLLIEPGPLTLYAKPSNSPSGRRNRRGTLFQRKLSG